MQLKSKAVALSICLLTAIYIFVNSDKIFATLNSSIWTRSFDLFNHVTNLNVHLVLISAILCAIGVIGLLSILLDLDINFWILLIIDLITMGLIVNVAIIPIRWMEINVFGGGALLLMGVVLLIHFLVKLYRKYRRRPVEHV